MGKEAYRSLEEAERILTSLREKKRSAARKPLKLEVEKVSRRLLTEFKKTSDRRFFDAFYHISKELMHAYTVHHLRGHKLPIDSEEVLNRTYLLLFEKLLAPREKVPLDYLFPWCYRVIMNLVKEEVRNLTRNRPLNPEISERLAGPSLMDFLLEEERKTDEKTLVENILDVLYSTASGLSERDRSIMRLFYLEGYSMREISVKMGMNKAHIGVILMRSRQRIARCLGQKRRR